MCGQFKTTETPRFRQEHPKQVFFSERVINRWNCLSFDVVTVKLINSFKSGLQRVRDTQIDFFMDE